MMDERKFPREKYLKRIRTFYFDYDIIKIITGVRRCGKSTILSSIKDELLESGVEEGNIIYLNLDSVEYYEVKKPE